MRVSVPRAPAARTGPRRARRGRARTRRAQSADASRGVPSRVRLSCERRAEMRNTARARRVPPRAATPRSRSPSRSSRAERPRSRRAARGRSRRSRRGARAGPRAPRRRAATASAGSAVPSPTARLARRRASRAALAPAPRHRRTASATVSSTSGPRAQPHAHLGDHAERAPRADEQPREVESGDVLHDAPAGAHDGARAVDELEAEREVARRAERRRCSGPCVAVANVAPSVPSSPPHGRSGHHWPCARGRRVDLGERRAGARGEREIAGHVLDDARQRRHVEQRSPRSRRRAGVRATSPRPAMRSGARRSCASRTTAATLRDVVDGRASRARSRRARSTRGTRATGTTLPGFARRSGSNASRRRHIASSDRREKSSSM